MSTFKEWFLVGLGVTLGYKAAEYMVNKIPEVITKLRKGE